MALLSLAVFYVSPACHEKLIWDRRALWPIVLSGTFETAAVLFMLVAFASGPVVVVSPISATAPIWTMILSAIFLREFEKLDVPSVVGTISVVAGVIAISLVK